MVIIRYMIILYEVLYDVSGKKYFQLDQEEGLYNPGGREVFPAGV